MDLQLSQGSVPGAGTTDAFRAEHLKGISPWALERFSSESNLGSFPMEMCIATTAASRDQHHRTPRALNACVQQLLAVLGALTPSPGGEALAG